MKKPWTKEAEAALEKMAYAGASNREIADALDRTLESVHAKRSHMGLTIAAVEQKKAAAGKKAPVRKEGAAASPAPQKGSASTSARKTERPPAKIERRFELIIREL